MQQQDTESVPRSLKRNSAHTVAHTGLMDAAATEVLELFATKLPPVWTVERRNLATGEVVVTTGARRYALVFDEADLLDALRGVGNERPLLWGTDVTPAETLARLISVHFDELVDGDVSTAALRWRWRGGFIALE